MLTSKKIISLILAIMLCASMALMFTSCSLIDKIMGKEDQGENPPSGDPGEEDPGEGETPEDPGQDDPSTPPTPSTPSEPAIVTYTVTVKNAAGEVIAANVQLGAADFFVPGKDTDAQGKVTFSVTEGEYTAQLTAVPEGYEADLSVKYEFDASYNAVITLEAAEATPEAPETPVDPETPADPETPEETPAE